MQIVSGYFSVLSQYGKNSQNHDRRSIVLFFFDNENIGRNLRWRLHENRIGQHNKSQRQDDKTHVHKGRHQEALEDHFQHLILNYHSLDPCGHSNDQRNCMSSAGSTRPLTNQHTKIFGISPQSDWVKSPGNYESWTCCCRFSKLSGQGD